MTETPPDAITDTRLLERTLSGLGIDRAVAWTVAGRVWPVLAGPISLVLIASHLNAEEQGFYYTFASIVSFQFMFELGLGLVVLQFASHEKAFLTWQPDGTVSGSDLEKGRLAGLLHKTVRWYAVATLLAVVVLLIGGTLFFRINSNHGTAWRSPWIAVAILAGATLFLTPFLAVLEGCGLVAEVARVRTWQVVASNLAAWTILIAGGRLWASPAILGSALLVGAAWVVLIHRNFFRDLLRMRGGGISWRDEIWPFQWRIGMSWISNYIIYHLFIPVLFLWRGPVAAGRMGMSLALASAVFMVSSALVTTKVPKFGELIARRDFAELDARFFPAMWRSFALMTLGAAVLISGTLMLRSIGHHWAERLLEPLPFALLLATMIVNTIFFAETVYLRAHKQEPMLGVYVASAIAVGLSTFLLGRAYGSSGMMLGYFAASVVITLGGGTWMFLRKRREWHA